MTSVLVLFALASECVAQVKDRFPHKVVVRHAAGFSVSYHGSYKRVVVARPWSGAVAPLEYVLLERGTPDPQVEGALLIEIPLKRAAVLSTTYLPHLDQLGVMDALVAVDDFDYVNTPSARAMIKSGVLREVGATINMNVERLIALKTDAVLSYTLDNTELSRRRLLARSGVKIVLGSSYLEASPLARTEWIKFTSLFFNREKEASAYFDEVEKDYVALTAMVAGVEARPSVMVGAPFKGIWHIPGGKSFVATLIRDAGGAYLWAGNTDVGGVPVAFESVYAKAHEAEIWLNPSQWRSLSDGQRADSRFALFDAFTKKRVYNNNRRLNAQGGNDIWETGVIKPHWVLRDLIRILHPDLLPKHDLYWYRRLDDELRIP